MVLAGDFFGPTNLGANYNFYDGLSSAFGSAFFALLLPSFAYGTYEDDASGDCLEPGCFRATYAVAGLLNCLAVGAALVLTIGQLHSGGSGGSGGGAGGAGAGGSKRSSVGPRPFSTMSSLSSRGDTSGYIAPSSGISSLTAGTESGAAGLFPRPNDGIQPHYKL